MFELVFLTGARAGETVPLVKSLMAGRSPECSLEIPDPNASRMHTKLLFDGSTVTAADNGSSNGSYVNEQRLTGPQKLKPGDVIRLGETRIRLQISMAKPEGSGIFDIKEAEEDLSQSILMSVADVRRSDLAPELVAVRLNAIIKVSETLVNIQRIELVFEGILEALFEAFPQADRGFLMLGSDVDKLEAKAFRQRDKNLTGGSQHVSKSICRQALTTRAGVLFDAQKSTGFDHGMSIVKQRIHSALTVPLLVGEEVLGLLQIDTTDPNRVFTSEDLHLAVAVGQQAAIALHNALLVSRIEQEATTRNNLMRFLPGPLVEQAMSGNIDLALGGRTCHGTLLFSDIVGFTRMSENLDPARVVGLMNSYFDRMVPCIEQSGGAIDKFMGDAIMAFWGIPFDKGDSALRAAHAALAMQNALVGLNSMPTVDATPTLDMGIGVNSGTVVAGNIGSSNRVEYTVLGDTVNTAQRLESAAGRSQVLITLATWKELQLCGFGLTLPHLKVKNKAEPVPTMSLRGLKILNNEIIIHLPVTCSGRRAYIIRRLTDQTFLILHPRDLDITSAPVLTAAAEWPACDLGTPVMEAMVPVHDSDGTFIRSQVRFPDPTLAGLLGASPLTSQLDWDAMSRGAVAEGAAAPGT